MFYIFGDLRNGYIIFLGEFNEVLFEGGGWNECFYYFWNVNFMACKLCINKVVKNNKRFIENFLV